MFVLQWAGFGGSNTIICFKRNLDSLHEVLYLENRVRCLFFRIIRFGVPLHSIMKRDEKGIPCSVDFGPGKSEAAPQL